MIIKNPLDLSLLSEALELLKVVTANTYAHPTDRLEREIKNTKLRRINHLRCYVDKSIKLPHIEFEP